MILKSILPVYPGEINFLIALATPDLPCFLRRLTVRILRDDEIEEDIESLTGLMEAFIVPLTSNIKINEDVFLIIQETNLVCNAFRYFMYIDCDNDFQWSASRFFEICTSHDFLHKEALYSVTDCDFTDIVDTSHNREFEQQIHFIVIISNLIQQLGYNAAELAIEYDILTLISSFIPDHIQYALNALDVLIEKYVEKDHGKTICDLIGETSIMQDLKDVTEVNDNDDEFDMIINFVNHFNNLANN
ncbi:hypothetical protein TVAG_237890 [Trichomonas vaginalis G3]|uniref:Uncharacterized protein n=1 Tax=Trichomonas vaginalis (strain ATCC PRA-98 / G3) TaxID=412133 RepID=A2DCY9_TRIV3|nr:hypothetical protein TVAGG3_0606320 [Trichomonas vaginalis G3]EAY21763.1 hypothetical protein TVAG_237890 [Trichomonas vaginalis G3]KAI5524265.1 hypothetical protein TVAGG3_0606320 [Trichomonas vaginalis G3]|eukprot:XP_001582749.1 hypothetical protein [Trichomonas vaginalis G3]